MATLKQRILWRAIPVGVTTVAAGYGLLWAHLLAARSMAAGVTVQSDGPQVVGPLLLGLVGFAIAAALEVLRRERS